MCPDYIQTDQAVSDEVFHSEPVPGPNTCSQETLTRFKTKTTRIINAFLRIPDGQVAADPYGELEETALKLFKKLVDNADPELEKADKYKLTDHGYAKPALISHKPDKSW